MKVILRILLVVVLLLVAGCTVLGIFGFFFTGVEYKQTLPMPSQPTPPN